MPLPTTDRLRFIEFLGLLAGLFVVFISTNQSQLVYLPFGLPSDSVFVLLLIVFIAYSLFVYAQILTREKTSTKFMFAAAVYFSIILSLLFSGTILKALAVEINTPPLADLLFVGLAVLYNVVILIPIRKIMNDEPSKDVSQRSPAVPPSKVAG